MLKVFTPALTPIVGALLLAASTALFAQPATPPGPGAGKGPRHFDCSQAKDPKACEERREKARAAYKKAYEACQGKQADERRDCMRQQGCAQAKDPAKCEARVKEGMERRQKMREACKGKTGDELRSCIRENRAGRK